MSSAVAPLARLAGIMDEPLAVLTRCLGTLQQNARTWSTLSHALLALYHRKFTGEALDTLLALTERGLPLARCISCAYTLLVLLRLKFGLDLLEQAAIPLATPRDRCAIDATPISVLFATLSDFETSKRSSDSLVDLILW